MKELLTIIISNGALTALAVWLTQKYLVGRIKFDFDKKLEGIKPLTAEETLRRQNYLNSKRDSFFEAVSLLCKHLEATPWTGLDIPNDRVLHGDRPTEAEVNSCIAKLAMYADDASIPVQFVAAFSATPASLGAFINQLRTDLGYDTATIDPESYPYFFKRSPDNNPA
jgi:hypothetical protein